MARYTITIEDGAQGEPVKVMVDKHVPANEDPQALTKAGKLATYARIKLFELELAAEQDRKLAEDHRTEKAARCWH